MNNRLHGDSNDAIQGLVKPVAVREQTIILTEHEYLALVNLYDDLSVSKAVRVSYKIPYLPYTYYRKHNCQHQFLFRSAPLKRSNDWLDCFTNI